MMINQLLQNLCRGKFCCTRVFAQIRGNSGKMSFAPQKFACFYTYVSILLSMKIVTVKKDCGCNSFLYEPMRLPSLTYVNIFSGSFQCLNQRRLYGADWVDNQISKKNSVFNINWCIGSYLVVNTYKTIVEASIKLNQLEQCFSTPWARPKSWSPFDFIGSPTTVVPICKN